MADPNLLDEEGVRRRDWIHIAALSAGGVGGVSLLYPLVSQMAPSADVLAASTTEVDVGKIEAGLGTFGRVVATLSAAVAGREMAGPWSQRRGFTRRVGLYLRHPELGADLLELAGSDPLTVAWAREHHLPEDRWSVPTGVGRALRDADDD
ncbi:MAG: ubiquinol-cytochrome c reductase iron-sulfur subunit N-terminal domain-containing protein [Erythrobacter sp.]